MLYISYIKTIPWGQIYRTDNVTLTAIACKIVFKGIWLWGILLLTIKDEPPEAVHYLKFPKTNYSIVLYPPFKTPWAMPNNLQLVSSMHLFS